jgi:hypothetical protein
LGYLEDEFSDNPELATDADIKTAAAKAYSEARSKQLENAEDLKILFKFSLC